MVGCENVHNLNVAATDLSDGMSDEFADKPADQCANQKADPETGCRMTIIQGQRGGHEKAGSNTARQGANPGADPPSSILFLRALFERFLFRGNPLALGEGNGREVGL